ncbi:hypothetical protein PDL71_10385 [Lacibacter sp. MH-610]|uniref:hypothetical protein n=1 Tax=Lacibacter sp. MH-610 TaxID=3020883 RepID=UPI003892AA10
MTTYSIPVYFEPFLRQKKAARLIHFLAGFLMIANAWGNFNQPNPDLLFVVIQIAVALLSVLFAFFGSRITKDHSRVNSILRVIQAFAFLYAAWYFFSVMNLTMMSFMQLLAAAGLFLLLITERKIFSSPAVKLDEKGIYTPNTPNDRFIAWSDIDNMLIKNDYISINTLKNQFIQYETNIILSELEMDEMNAFCRQHFTQS